MHGATFEWKFLAHHGRGYRPPPHRRVRFRCECSLQATGLLTGVGFGGETRRLDRAAKYFLQLDVPKELQTSDWGAVQLAPGQLAYAASDAVIARKLWPVLRTDWSRSGAGMPTNCSAARSPRWPTWNCAASPSIVTSIGGRPIYGPHQLAEAREDYVVPTGKPPPSKPAEIRTWLGDVLPADELARWPRTKTDGLLSMSTDALKTIGHIAGAPPGARHPGEGEVAIQFRRQVGRPDSTR